MEIVSQLFSSHISEHDLTAREIFSGKSFSISSSQSKQNDKHNFPIQFPPQTFFMNLKQILAFRVSIFARRGKIQLRTFQKYDSKKSRWLDLHLNDDARIPELASVSVHLCSSYSLQVI